MSSYTYRNEILARMGFESYQQYLESDLWASIRQKVIDASNRICCGCRKRATQVHHASYTEVNLRGVFHEHLYAICNRCHREIEFDDKNNKILDMNIVDSRLKALIHKKAHPEPSPFQSPKAVAGYEKCLRENVTQAKSRVFALTASGEVRKKHLSSLRRAERALEEFIKNPVIPLPAPKKKKPFKKINSHTAAISKLQALAFGIKWPLRKGWKRQWLARNS